MTDSVMHDIPIAPIVWWRKPCGGQDGMGLWDFIYHGFRYSYVRQELFDIQR